MLCQGAALAQQTLPGIVVGAARPIKPRMAARTQSRPPAPPRAAPPTPAAPEAPDGPPRGALHIVADQFATVTVVSNEELRRSTGATLGDVLFSKPGVTGSTFAPGAASRPIIRGLDNYRVRIQENGIGASGVSELGEDHAVPLDPLGASQIEVVRGPATLRWGSQAVGGVVNASNRRIPEAPPCREGAAAPEKAVGCARLEMRSAVATVANGLETAALLDAGRENVAIHADVHGRRASDYRISAYPYLFPPDPAPLVGGRQPNSSNRSGGASLGGSYFFDAGYFGVAVTQFDSLYRIPGVEPAETGTRIDLRQTKVTAKGAFRPQSTMIDSIRFWSGLTDYKHHELADEGDGDGVRQTFTSKAHESRVEVQLAPLDVGVAKMAGVVGLQGTYQALTAPGREGGLFDPNRTKSVAGFLFDEFRLSETSRAQIAGRIELVEVTGSFPNLLVAPGLPLPRNRNFAPKSGAVGFLQNLPGDMVASLTAQYVERAPRAPELLSRGAHESTGTFDIGNPDLRIEAAKSVELGLRRAVGPFRFEATVFYTRFDGFIFRNFTGRTCGGDFASCAPAGEGGGLRQAVYAQRDAIFRGAEFQSQWDATPLMGGVLGVENRFDVVRATFAGGGNVPRIPPVRLGGGLFWRDANWLARVDLLHAFPQNCVDPTAETQTRGYNLLKAEISYRTTLDPRSGREMTLGLVGNNLLDEAMRNSVSFRKDEVLLPGADLRFFANMSF